MKYILSEIERKAADIGHRIRSEREEARLSQYELCHIINIGRNTLSACENGKKMLQLEDMLKLCSIFDCELGYLLFEHDCKTRTRADVQEETGLTEWAIESLAKCKKMSGDGNIVFSVILQILSSFIENEDSLIEVARTLVEYESIDSGSEDRLEATGKGVLLVSGEDAKKFLIYNIQQEILKNLLHTVGGDSNGT